MFEKSLFVSSLVVLFVVEAVSGDLWTTLGNIACKHDDSKCIKESAKTLLPYFAEGIPEYGIEKVDPLFMKHVDASTPSLKFVIDDITVRGLKDCHIRKIVRDATKSKITIKVTCSALMEGHYVMKGRLLVLPIEGDGKITVGLKNAKINVFLDMQDITGEDGKQHWDIKKWEHTYDLKEKSHLVFENLFNGNEAIGRAARELISTNANDIINEIGPPVIKAIVKRIVDSCNSMFHVIPADAIALN